MQEKKIAGKIFDVSLFKRLLRYAKKYRIAFFVATTSVILLAVFAAIRPVLLGYIIDNFVVKKIPKALLKFMLIMLVFLILEAFFQFVFIFFANYLGQNIIKDIRLQLFEKIIRFKMNYFDTTPVGKIVTRVVSDIETIASIFGQGLFVIISDLLKMLVIAVVMLVLNWRLALIVFVALPILIYATRIFQKAMKIAFQKVRAEVSNLNTFVQERLTGMKIVQLFAREEIEYNKFKEINNRHKNAWIKTVWYNSIFFPIAELIPSIALGFVVWYGGLQMLESTTTTSGDIVSFIMMNQMLFRPLRQIADKFNTLQMGMVASERVFKVMDKDLEEKDTGKIEKDIKGGISFKNVHFSYNDKEKVLKGISFSVKQGETIAVVGATGAGKSTIVNLLNRFYTIDSGQILLDNINIYDYKLFHLRKNIAIVLQDVFLFSDTIYNNITLFDNSISIEEVMTAAKKIGIHDFIMSLPNNYQFNVKERGVMLSSGQRQLIAFLRAYVRNPRLLILDEATSSIDSKTETLIQKATDILTKNRSSIIIAHRLATIKKASKIIVMDKGVIVEQGTHQELLNKNGYYRSLYELQFEKTG
jgi:subfamily B ATP-binding cassette protein MsbA